MQRRGLGRTAGIARYIVQRVYRNIEPIAALVLEDQELPGLATDLHRLQPDVATDPVLLMHHRRTGGERLQIAQYRVRVGGGRLPPSAFLSCTGAEELGFREQCQRCTRQAESLQLRCDGQTDTIAAGKETLPTVAGRRLQAGPAQQFAEHLAPSR